MDNSIVDGSIAMSTKNSGTSRMYTNLIRRSRLNCLKLGKLKLLTMSKPAQAVIRKAPMSPVSPGSGQALANQINAATIAAADGLGRPSKYLLSAVAARALKRARRSAAAAA